MIKKNTKKSLLASLLSLVLSCSMLIGSTFAWFSDEVVSNNNKIQSGTLSVDLELLDKDTGKWESIKESKKPIFNHDLWEPGYTDVKVLKIENEGTLALKWIAKFVAEKELSKLANVIDVYVYPSETEIKYPVDRKLDGYKKVGTISEFVNTVEDTTYGDLEANESAYLGIALKMQETADNQYQGLDLSSFDITILATQLSSESDSFDIKYDEQSEYPKTYEVSTGSELSTAINNATSGDTVKLKEDISITYLTVEKDIVIDLNGNEITTSLSHGGLNLKNGSSIVNGTINHNGLVTAIRAYNGCTIENVTINVNPSTTNKVVTGIAVQQYATVKSIKNVIVNGASRGIEVGYQANVGTIDNAKVNAVTNGSAVGTALVISGGRVDKALNCDFSGEVYGVDMQLKGVYQVGLDLERCNVTGTTASIYAHDEVGKPNTTNCSLTLTYDSDTTLNGNFIWEFENECKGVVTLNKPQ